MLTLATGEMYGETERRVDQDEVEGEAVMEGVEHLGQYVYEMTKAKIEALKAGGGVPVSAQRDTGMVLDEEDGDREDKVLVAEDEDLGPEEPEEVVV